ncbi:hypothetical protein BLNAU_2064 [Blattamonas nauphoetae]|uniref:Uncharacterized protein n=1 Tax=Blattamonas nauphoetae TaxID=2049346 RepID=A0ABQ9YH07_9EUKA|nr:hypothetical protein BLNAU_2064 [Blattamonas nauphoetae]
MILCHPLFEFIQDPDFWSSQSLKKKLTIDTYIDELERGLFEPDAIVTTQAWRNLPTLLRDGDVVKEENLHKLDRLIRSIVAILTECLRNDISIDNRRLLHSSLSALAASSTCPPVIRVGVDQCLAPLNSLKDGQFVLLSTDEFKSMEDDAQRYLNTTSTQNTEINQLNHTIATLQQRQKEDEEKLMKEREEMNAKVGEMEAMLTKQREEKKELLDQLEREKEREQASENARREGEARIEQLLIENKNLANNLTESKDREKKAEEREVKTNDDRRGAELSRKQMEEEKKKAEMERARMEEEKKKAESERARMEEEKKKAELSRKQMEEEKKKAEAERGKMEQERRQAEEKRRSAEERLKNVEEQARREKERLSNEVKNTQKELGEVRAGRQKSENENRGLILQIDKLKQQLAHLPIWLGTESLQTFDSTTHRLTPTTLSQIVYLAGNTDWRTVFTFPISDGEWELKIEASGTTFMNVMLGFLKHPLPANATQRHCGNNSGGFCGDFVLWDGSMWNNGEIKPAGTNKKCERYGQTAAIRVNMSTRLARLVVDEMEQPGIFTNIPSPLCLGITTRDQNKQIQVEWLKRLRS